MLASAVPVVRCWRGGTVAAGARLQAWAGDRANSMAGGEVVEYVTMATPERTGLERSTSRCSVVPRLQACAAAGRACSSTARTYTRYFCSASSSSAGNGSTSAAHTSDGGNGAASTERTARVHRHSVSANTDAAAAVTTPSGRPDGRSARNPARGGNLVTMVTTSQPPISSLIERQLLTPNTRPFTYSRPASGKKAIDPTVAVRQSQRWRGTTTSGSMSTSSSGSDGEVRVPTFPDNGPTPPAFRRREFKQAGDPECLGTMFRITPRNSRHMHASNPSMHGWMPSPAILQQQQQPQAGMSPPGLGHGFGAVAASAGWAAEQGWMSSPKGPIQHGNLSVPTEPPFVLHLKHPLVASDSDLQAIFQGCSPLEMKLFRSAQSSRNVSQFVFFPSAEHLAAALQRDGTFVQLGGQPREVAVRLSTRYTRIREAMRSPPYVAFLRTFPDGLEARAPALMELFKPFRPVRCAVHQGQRDGTLYALMEFPDKEQLMAAFDAHLSEDVRGISIGPSDKNIV